MSHPQVRRTLSVAAAAAGLVLTASSPALALASGDHGSNGGKDNNGKHGSNSHQQSPAPAATPKPTPTSAQTANGAKGNGSKGRTSTKPTRDDPRGNNGIIKVDGLPFDTSHGNEPHVRCGFRLNFWGFDQGQRANVTFSGQSPTRTGTLLSYRNVLISDTPAGGGNDLESFHIPATGALTAAALGLGSATPHPKQGYHLRVEVNALNADGSSVPGGAKSKVFWLEPCATSAPTPAPTPAPTRTAHPVPGAFVLPVPPAVAAATAEQRQCGCAKVISDLTLRVINGVVCRWDRGTWVRVANNAVSNGRTINLQLLLALISVPGQVVTSTTTTTTTTTLTTTAMTDTVGAAAAAPVMATAPITATAPDAATAPVATLAAATRPTALVAAPASARTSGAGAATVAPQVLASALTSNPGSGAVLGESVPGSLAFTGASVLVLLTVGGLTLLGSGAVLRRYGHRGTSSL